MNKIRVVIIEDDATLREGFTYLLNNRGSLEVVNAYASYEDAQKEMRQNDPDVVLLDIELPGLNGIDAIDKIIKVLPTVKIIVLTVFDNEETVFKALANGAAGYLTKNVSSEKIIDSIEEVMSGGGAMTANIARMVMSSFHRNTADSPLTKRETEILENIAQGKSRSKIAKELFIDVQTVKSHIKNIYFKLNVHSRDEAIRTAKSNKFI